MNRRVRLAMLDSGVSTRHPHIQREPAGGVTILPDGERQGFADTLGHGTAICALLQHMAPEADLFAVKIFDKRLATSLPVVRRAIDWCVQHQIDIINLSLGTTNQDYRPHFLAAIERVRSAGAVLVSAYEVNTTPMLPGALPQVIGVVGDPDCPRESSRVLRGDRPHVAACPYPLDIPGVPRERNLQGASFAVAHISAHIARTWHKKPADQDWIAELDAESLLRGKAR